MILPAGPKKNNNDAIIAMQLTAAMPGSPTAAAFLATSARACGRAGTPAASSRRSRCRASSTLRQCGSALSDVSEHISMILQIADADSLSGIKGKVIHYLFYLLKEKG